MRTEIRRQSRGQSSGDGVGEQRAAWASGGGRVSSGSMPNASSVPPLSQAQLLSPECGQHLVEAEDLLQKHGLLEGDIAAQSERVEALNAAALRFSQLQGESVLGPGRRLPQLLL